ncbi:hypothetical protein ACFLSY_01915, partial [Bacteroidota bacterium]
VEQRLFYEGDREVNNYDKDFRFLRYDNIYLNHFNTNTDGGSKRQKLLTKVLFQKKKLDNMEKQGKSTTNAYKNLNEEYIINAKKLDWQFDEKN